MPKMASTPSIPDSGYCRPADRAYKSVPLVHLLKLIAEQADQAALDELHGRRRLPAGNGQLLLAEYVAWLASASELAAAESAGTAVLDLARDLTIDRFLHLPPVTGTPTTEPPEKPASRRCRGVDCRRHYRAFLRKLDQKGLLAGRQDSLHTELQAARLLRSFVRRHFKLAIREARRRLQAKQIRHPWRVNGGVIRVWMPRRLTAKQRTAWLTANVSDPDPSRPGERKRVQAIIDQHFASPQTLSLHQPDGRPVEVPDTRPAVSFGDSYGISVQGLSLAVADEKAEHIGEQRSAIRALGAETLRALIQRVFTSLTASLYNESEIAREYGLSKATFSRFAGSRWPRSRRGAIPDLWRNAARLLATHGPYQQALADLGLWPVTEKTCDNGPMRKGKDDD